MPVVAIVAATTMGASLAACGSSGGSTPAAGSSPTSSSSGAAGAAGFTAYRNCLSSHGVTIPTGRPSGTRPSGTRPSGGGGGFGGFGGGFGGASANPSAQAALKACASLRPAGTGRGFAGSSALTAFRNCMSREGVTIPTGSPSPGTTRRGFLGGLSTSDPKVAQAYAVCKALLPTGRPTATSSTTG